jgi:hypothetical protein
MAHFYGTVQGHRGEASRLGAKSAGIHTEAAGWSGCIDVQVFFNEKDQRDEFIVRLKPWGSSGGESRVIAEGILDSGITDPFIPALIA